MPKLSIFIVCLVCASGLCAQGNYEVQVYGSDLVPKGVTMVEMHSNFTASGTKGTVDGVLPTNHAEHQTLEITHGFNRWFETGFYQFTSIQPDGSWRWVGTHIRPRVAIPESYHLPVGLSLSTEIGYQRPIFLIPDDRVRPIVDKKIRKLYMSFNLTLEMSPTARQERQSRFLAQREGLRDIVKQLAFGLEYGAYGKLTFRRVRDTEQMFIPAVDIDFANWEFNFGVGVGVTQATDHLLIKAILGYRFNNKKN